MGLAGGSQDLPFGGVLARQQANPPQPRAQERSLKTRRRRKVQRQRAKTPRPRAQKKIHQKPKRRFRAQRQRAKAPQPVRKTHLQIPLPHSTAAASAKSSMAAVSEGDVVPCAKRITKKLRRLPLASPTDIPCNESPKQKKTQATIKNPKPYKSTDWVFSGWDISFSATRRPRPLGSMRHASRCKP